MERVEVLIVGAGASGSLLAAKLAQGGKQVLILETGPERRLDGLYSSQIWARRLKWGGPLTESSGTDPIGVVFNHGWGTGGSATHHYAAWLRLHPEDFELRTRFDRGLDWPISYEALRPYYDRVQREVGLSGDAQAEVWRPPGDPYPMPPLAVFAQGRLIARGFERLGLRTAPIPVAINSVEYRGRPACLNDGWCDAGCPIGALANPLVLYLPRAQRAGAHLRHQATVTRVLTGAKGDRVSGVEYYDPEGQRHEVGADVVILAAFAVQTPRLLLNSAGPRHPKGLANSSGQVGKYVTAHSAVKVFGLFSDETENYLGVSAGQLMSHENYAKDPHKGYLASSQWLIGPALKPNDLLGVANARPELFGEELHRFLGTASHHLANMILFGEDLPRPENRVQLSDKRDRYGLPLARLVHEFGPDERKCVDAGTQQGQAIFKAAGAMEVWASGLANVHIMGGTIMGRTPQESVTNSYGQCHDLPNLFIAGPGLFPTSGAVNPTFTIHALALRTADYLLQHWPG